jgi:hypothetical protein
MLSSGWRHSSSGATTSLASNPSLAESPTTCGPCASTGASLSVAMEAAVCWDDEYAVKRLAEVRAV